MRMLLPCVALLGTIVCQPGPALAAIAAPQAAAQPPAKPPAPRPRSTAKPDPAAARGVVLTIEITDLRGAGQEGVKVTTSGPVIREATTDASGLIRLAGMKPGDYRLRLEREGLITLERDVTVKPGQSMAVDITMSAAPAPPPAPEPPPAPAAPAMGPVGEPRVLSLSDFIEKNLIAREPMKTSSLGCSGVLQSVLLQVRDPLPEQTDDQIDQTIYVVAGQGTLKMNGRDTPLGAAVFAFIPRGTPYSLTRRGGTPLIVLQTRANEACGAAK